MSVVMAYIDPGAGAMILQWVMAAVVGAGIFFRRALSRILRKVFRRDSSGNKDEKDKPTGNP
jgi:hypothetical protein